MERRAGLAAMAGAVMAIVGNGALLLVDPSVPKHQVSYPLLTGAYAAGQLWFALTQALMTVGIVTLVRSSLVAPGRGRSVFGILAGIGMAITVPGELILIAVSSDDVDSSAASAASTVFGVGMLLAVIGLIGYGVLALRQRRWAWPWPAWPITFALFQLLVVTPVSLALGFASLASFVVIALSDAWVALLGWHLFGERAGDESTRPAQSVGA
jgi:hypothetical protein